MSSLLCQNYFHIIPDSTDIAGVRTTSCPSFIGRVSIVWNSKLVIVSQMEVFKFFSQCCCWVALRGCFHELQHALHTGLLYNKLTTCVARHSYGFLLNISNSYQKKGGATRFKCYNTRYGRILNSNAVISIIPSGQGNTTTSQRVICK